MLRISERFQSVRMGYSTDEVGGDTGSERGLAVEAGDDRGGKGVGGRDGTVSAEDTGVERKRQARMQNRLWKSMFESGGNLRNIGGRSQLRYCCFKTIFKTCEDGENAGELGSIHLLIIDDNTLDDNGRCDPDDISGRDVTARSKLRLHIPK